MTRNLPNGLAIGKSLFTFVLFSLLFVSTSHAQSYKGKDGAKSYTLPGTYILNRYTTLASSVSAGSLSVVVSNIAELSGSYSFTNSVNPYVTNALSRGDLVMIIQVQGADITATDDAAYGDVTNYNNTGFYEVRTVYAVSANTISLCENLSHSYTQSGNARTQVIRIPRLTTLDISLLANIGGLPWQGATGGVIALETSGNFTLEGKVSATGIGFRGGSDDKTSSITSGTPAVTLYRTTSTATTAGKGESIAGFTADYNTYFNGANGRGAPANGGGGGNGHNSGGGGGTNAGNNGVLIPYNGTGIKNTSTPAWASAWNLESASFATDVSTGAGRGGYSYANSNQDALVLGPSGNAWGGDHRNNVGGMGARPLDSYSNTRVFLGGGGGAGDGNNSAAGNGGTGGGFIYILSNGNIAGSGSIEANGENGYNTQDVNIDAAGGAGGGGAIVALSNGTITGISIQANGGVGGNQLYLPGEAEGPGGGGGGGYIATTSTGISKSVAGGTNGTSASALVTEFLPNGATSGTVGTIASKTFYDVFACDAAGGVLPVKLSSFNAAIRGTDVTLTWVIESNMKENYFEVERSTDGTSFRKVYTLSSSGTTGRGSYQQDDNISGLGSPVFYYRLKMFEADGKYSYSETRTVHSSTQALMGISTFPNPAVNQLTINLPQGWQGQKVKLEMFDVSGKLTKSVDMASATTTTSISVSDLGKGLYVVKASMGGESAHQRIIKN
jgi:Secretion system C-terminal sorting domain